jgi:undecaprenyl-diphosphatase
MKPSLFSSRVLRLYLRMGSVLVCAGVFLALAGRVLEGDTRAVDDRLLLALRDPSDLSKPLGPSWFAEAVRDITSLGSVPLLAIALAVAVGYLLLAGKRRFALFTLLATLGGSAFSFALKGSYSRPRPAVVPHLSEVMTSSFPSGHAMHAAVVFLTFGGLLAEAARHRRLKIYILVNALLVTALVGFSRVYLGVHYPSDVLGGWIAGLGWAGFSAMVARWLRRVDPQMNQEGRHESP